MTSFEVCAGPTIDQLDAQVVHVERHPVLERDGRRLDLDLAPIDARKQRLRPHPRLDHFFPAQLVADDHRLGLEDEVPVRVVAVVVRVHERPHRQPAHRTDRVPEGPRAPLREAGIDRHHAIAADDEAGVVQPPAPVRLDVGEDAPAHLFHARRGQLDVVGNVRSGHGGPPRHEYNLRSFESYLVLRTSIVCTSHLPYTVPRWPAPPSQTSILPPAMPSRKASASSTSWRFYDCHETLEDVWREVGSKGDEATLADFYQGIIKVAAGFHHVLRDNQKGAVNLLSDAFRLLERFRPATLGVDVERLIAKCALASTASSNWARSACASSTGR